MPAGLLCGAASVDITPHAQVPGAYLAGFESNRRARAVLDPLEANAISLSGGETHVALVAVDLVGLQRPWVEWIRDRLAADHPQPHNVLVCSTHTHSGPDTMGLWGPSFLGRFPRRTGLDPAYQDALLDLVASAVRQAHAARVPVTVRAARFDVPADWTRNDRKGGGKDDFGHAVAFDAADGGARVATIVDFAAHPETLWEGSPLVSSDYPGTLRRRMRSLAGGQCAFFSGALGGMVTPNVPLSANLEERKSAVIRLGTGLAERAHAALRDAPPLADTGLAAARRPLALPLANTGFKVMKLLGVMDREFMLGRVRTEMTCVRIGDALSFLTAPGECTPEVGREVVARAPGEHRLLLCLGCDELGYVLTREQWENKEYAYERSMSVGPDTASSLCDAADWLRARL